MSTAVDPNIDSMPQPRASAGEGSEEEDGPQGPMPFKWYLNPDPCFEIL